MADLPRRDDLARGFALSRIALGVTALAAPRTVSKAFGLGDGPATVLAGRYLGCRDLVSGLGIVLSERHGSARGWYEAAAMIDIGDTAITLAAARRGHLSWTHAALVSVLAASSAAVGLALAATASSPSPAAAPESDTAGAPG